MMSDRPIVAIAAGMTVTALVVLLLVVARNLLVPLAVAVVVWYLINAFAEVIGRIRIGKWKPARWLAVTCSLILIVIFIAMFVGIVGGTIDSATAAAGRYRTNLEGLLQRISALVGFDLSSSGGKFLGGLVKDINIGKLIGAVASAVGSIAGNLSIIIIYVAFLLVEQAYFRPKLLALFPDSERRSRVQSVLGRISREMQTYLWIKTVLAVLTGFITWLLFWFIGLDFAVFWGFLTFLLYYIPTVGSIVAILLPTLIALMQFSSLWPAVLVLFGVGGAQTVIANVLEPRMMGQSLNLSAFVIILSLFLWNVIWGVTGMLLCVPITVMLMIIFAEFKSTRPIAIALSANGRIGVQDEVVKKA